MTRIKANFYLTPFARSGTGEFFFLEILFFNGSKPKVAGDAVFHPI
jgi:hypothetical protein